MALLKGIFVCHYTKLKYYYNRHLIVGNMSTYLFFIYIFIMSVFQSLEI